MTSRAARPPRSPHDARVVPLVEERPAVARAAKVTGRVRVRKRVVASDVPVDVDVTQERVKVTRHRIGREVSEAPAVRQDGDTTIVPVVEERVVVEKRLFLSEEIHVTRVRSRAHVHRAVKVRAERIEVEHIEENGSGDGNGPGGPAGE